MLSSVPVPEGGSSDTALHVYPEVSFNKYLNLNTLSKFRAWGQNDASVFPLSATTPSIHSVLPLSTSTIPPGELFHATDDT